MSRSRLPAMASRSSRLSRVQRALALSWYSAQFFSMSVQSIAVPLRGAGLRLLLLRLPGLELALRHRGGDAVDLLDLREELLAPPADQVQLVGADPAPAHPRDDLEVLPVLLDGGPFHETLLFCVAERTAAGFARGLANPRGGEHEIVERPHARCP